MEGLFFDSVMDLSRADDSALNALSPADANDYCALLNLFYPNTPTHFLVSYAIDSNGEKCWTVTLGEEIIYFNGSSSFKRALVSYISQAGRQKIFRFLESTKCYQPSVKNITLPFFITNTHRFASIKPAIFVQSIDTFILSLIFRAFFEKNGVEFSKKAVKLSKTQITFGVSNIEFGCLMSTMTYEAFYSTLYDEGIIKKPILEMYRMFPSGIDLSSVNDNAFSWSFFTECVWSYEYLSRLVDIRLYNDFWLHILNLISCMKKIDGLFVHAHNFDDLFNKVFLKRTHQLLVKHLQDEIDHKRDITIEEAKNIMRRLLPKHPTSSDSTDSLSPLIMLKKIK
tara:strand:+ start:1516 stop:2535 length:1020 start_codon:yes stop_codon:yes gene_type:complete